MWVKLTSGNYRNTEASATLQAVDLGGGNFGTAGTTIDGISEASESAAQDVIRQLVGGVYAPDVL